MSTYGQFCPVARAAEVLGERWTLLIVRELLLGSTRFNELQRGLSRISPSLLTRRLQELEAAHILYRQKIQGQKGYEYHLTKAGLNLRPLVMEMASWGINWIEDQFSEEELDLELLMFDMHRNIDAGQFPSSTTTLKFHFFDADVMPDWWIVASNDNIDLCTKDPGHEPDVYLTTCIRGMTEVWMGQVSWRQALQDDTVKALGNTSMIKQVPGWLGVSPTVAMKATA